MSERLAEIKRLAPRLRAVKEGDEITRALVSDLARGDGMSKRSRYRIAKYMGDDAYSWALFEDGRPIMTGMDRREASWRLKQARAAEGQS